MNRLLLLFFGVVLVAINSYLFATAQVDYLHYEAALDGLHKLSVSQAKIRQDLVKARLELLPNYDSLAQLMQYQRRLKDRLIQGSDKIYQQGSLDVDEGIEALREILDQQHRATVRYQNTNSIQKNSTAYFQEAVQNLIISVLESSVIDVSRRGELAERLRYLQNVVLQYSSWGGVSLTQDIRQELESLQGLADRDPSMIGDAAQPVIEHVEVILKYRPVTDTWLRLVLDLPVEETVADLTGSFRDAFGEQVVLANRHRYALYLFSLLLAAYIGVVIYRLRRMTSQLVHTNDALRIEMQERSDAEEEIRVREAELAHVTRLSTMGEMATGLAHELNQPLAAISTYCDATLKMVASVPSVPEKLISTIDKTGRQAHRAGEIIRSLRRFVDKKRTQASRADINELVHEVVDLAGSEARRIHAGIELHLAAGLPELFVDRIQIEQVLLNLVRNALEAMTTVSPKRIIIRTAQSNDGFVTVTVEDTGIGWSDGACEQIFEAFHTTKADGMGMGLAISRSIIEAHGGELRGRPRKPAAGVEFTFTLPSVTNGNKHG